MTVDVTNYLLIGVEIDKEKLWEKKQIRVCKHKIENKIHGKFCPECGKLLWEDKNEYIKEYKDNDKTLGEKFGCESLCGHKIFYTTDNRRVFVGVELIKLVDKNDDAVIIPDKMFKDSFIQEKKQQIKKELEPLGMWNEKKFGFWMISYCSY